ncbi:MAG: hypothetical protein JRH01_22375 [Deltaproteobacteria bacterium]|nr:hypothetical protein [Deltaproteobacteria bacterium]
MSIPQAWSAEAFNQATKSENRIHSDEIAKEYGFRGALVPGVTVSAYLIHPAVAAWGEAWLERGRAQVVVHSPVYDREMFRVDVSKASPSEYDAELFDPTGARCATAHVELAEPDAMPSPSKLRHDAILGRDFERPKASRKVMEHRQRDGLLATRARWNDTAEITSYLRDPERMAAPFSKLGFANPAFVLGLTNWALAGNVKMSPWLHLQTDSQNYRPIAANTELVVESSIADLFEKKGHEFIDVDMNIFDRATEALATSVRLRAIYKLRPPSGT